MCIIYTYTHAQLFMMLACPGITPPETPRISWTVWYRGVQGVQDRWQKFQSGTRRLHPNLFFRVGFSLPFLIKLNFVHWYINTYKYAVVLTIIIVIIQSSYMFVCVYMYIAYIYEKKYTYIYIKSSGYFGTKLKFV